MPAPATEKRGGIAAEIRSTDAGISVSGYAAVFDQWTDIGGWFMESIDRHAFDEAIGRDDVPLLVNHDGLPLARSRGGQGTLRLSVDGHGLKIETVLDPADPDVQAVVPKMKRGDLDKMSFAFRVTSENWDETEEPARRRILKCELYDVSIVTTPAYDGTDVGLRSLEAARRQNERQQRSENFTAAQRRLRMKINLALREKS